MRILLLSDRDGFREEYKEACAKESHHLIEAESVQAYDKAIANYDCDVVICEFTFLEHVVKTCSAPIFGIVPKEEDDNRVAEVLFKKVDGLIGAHRNGEVAFAQTVAFLRRIRARGEARRFVSRYGLMIDLERHRVQVKEQDLQLTLTELRVLRELAFEDDRIVPRAQIQSKVFGQLDKSKRALDVHVCSLRKKLRSVDIDVESVRGVGYRLAPFAPRQRSNRRYQ